MFVVLKSGLRQVFTLDYFRFLLLLHLTALNRKQKVYEEFRSMFAFVDEGLEKGESVLIHCAAGMPSGWERSSGSLLVEIWKSFCPCDMVAPPG